jgi:hypothetical protein
MSIKPKEKFIVKQEFKNFNIKYDADNTLLKPIFNSKDKNSVELTKLAPDDFNVPYNTKKKLIDTDIFYYSNQSNGAGRGFGNLDTSNQMHFGNSSREDRMEWKQYKESIVMDRFEFIDKEIMNPKHHVMDDIPRGGISTRKQITVDNNENKISSRITFDYN